MDNGHSFNNNRMDSSVLIHHDEKEAEDNPDDILVRRLKNRERQRRYRARKRQEADLRKASSVDQSTLPQNYQQLHTEFVSVPVEVELAATVPDCLTRVHCQRDWKKDARTAHIHKKQEISPVGPTYSTPTAAFVDSGISDDYPSNKPNDPSLENCAAHGSQSIRRHWKVEARNKRSSE